MFEQVMRYQDSLWDFGLAGNACMILHHGDLVYQYASGWADIERHIPITGDTIFQLYSMTKPVTCTAMLILAQKGKLSLDASVAQYFPEYMHLQVRNRNGTLRSAEKPIRIWDLMRMTAGIGYDLNAEPLAALACRNPNYSTREYARAIAEIPLAFEPGEGWLYGLCHDVLAAIAEEIAQRSFGDFLRETIFDPLGMDSAYFHIPEKKVHQIAKLYAWEKGKTPTLPTEQANPFQQGRHESGGAGLQCTLHEYAKFAQALLQSACGQKNALLAPEYAALLCTNQLTTNMQREDFSSFKPQAPGYGMGVFAAPSGRRCVLGWGGAAGTYLHIDAEEELVVLQAYQSQPNPADIVRPVLIDKVYGALGAENPHYYA